MNSALSHPQFMNVFIEILNKKPYSEHKELFLSEQFNVYTSKSDEDNLYHSDGKLPPKWNHV
jgi:hypothetical protein